MAKSSKPLGAAFSHARKVVKDNGGGKAAERAAANRYLKKKGRAGISKSHTCPLCDPLLKSRYMDAYLRLQKAIDET